MNKVIFYIQFFHSYSISFPSSSSTNTKQNVLATQSSKPQSKSNLVALALPRFWLTCRVSKKFLYRNSIKSGDKILSKFVVLFKSLQILRFSAALFKLIFFEGCDNISIYIYICIYMYILLVYVWVGGCIMCVDKYAHSK